MNKEWKEYRKALRQMKLGDTMPRMELPEQAPGTQRRVTVIHPYPPSLAEEKPASGWEDRYARMEAERRDEGIVGRIGYAGGEWRGYVNTHDRWAAVTLDHRGGGEFDMAGPQHGAHVGTLREKGRSVTIDGHEYPVRCERGEFGWTLYSEDAPRDASPDKRIYLDAPSPGTPGRVQQLMDKARAYWRREAPEPGKGLERDVDIEPER